ncbi:MAG: hypothetical protein QOJ00_1283 [Actinomycetota bacterium]
MKYVLLIGVTAIVARVARDRLRRALGRQPVAKRATPVRASLSLALVVTLFMVAGPLTEAITLAGSEPPRFRSALLWAAVGVAPPLGAACSYRQAKAARAPSALVRQSALATYSFVGLAVAAGALALRVSGKV